MNINAVKESNENFIRFDEKSNTYDSLEKLLLFLSDVEKDLSFWKWAIIALHSSLYGSMILSLKGTTPTRVIEINKHLREKFEKLYNVKLNENDSKQTARIRQLGKLIKFMDAFERIKQEKYMKMNAESECFHANEKHKKSIKWLNSELRNQFIHFLPCGWSINILDLKNVFKQCFEIIEFCLFKSNNVFFDEGEQRKFERVFKRVKTREILS